MRKREREKRERKVREKKSEKREKKMLLAEMLKTIDILAEMLKISKSWVDIMMYNSTLSPYYLKELLRS